MMRKLINALFAVLLFVSIAGCTGSSEEESIDDAPAESEPAAQEIEDQEPVGSDETEKELSDEELAEEFRSRIVGEWTYQGLTNYEYLTINEDGTGSYVGIMDKDFTFDYQLYVVHREYGNGEPFTDYTVIIETDAGEREEIVLNVREDTGELTLHTGDSGYSGTLFNFPDFIRRAQDQ